MPRRDDIHKILIIGSGPIVIGQACEFDYSGTQACKALREEGYEVVLVNSNPATIMTDPEMADRTYIEPITWEIVAEDHRGRAARRAAADAGRPDGLEPGDGPGRGTACWKSSACEMIGAKPEVIDKAEERAAVQAGDGKDRPGSLPRRHGAQPGRSPRADAAKIGLPCVIRPSFTLGGSGSAVAYNRDEFDTLVTPRSGAVAGQRSADRRIGHRLERIRDGGDARRRRQRRDHLLDRKLRPDGRAHGRFDHRGPGPDADRQGISADARRLAGRDPRDRRRDGRLEHPVRHPSADRADDRHRDESARQPLQRAGLARPPAFRSPRSRPSWPSATGCTNCPTTSRARRWPVSSRRSTTW